MKKILPIIALLLLTACAKTVKFTVAYNTQDPVRRTELEAAVQRVVEGRMVSRDKKVLQQGLMPGNADASILTIRVSDPEAVKILSDGLTTPFTMSIMKQVPAGQGDIVSEKFGDFKETGITTEHFDWVAMALSVSEASISQGSVVIKFTKEGQALLKETFAKNRGGIIGIFVRGQLMSKKLVDAKDKQDAIQIDGIPSTELAGAFADDVNVGLHVTFSPMP